MKVAYCIGGHLRLFKKSQIKERILDKNPGDVYLFTWDKLDFRAGDPIIDETIKQEMFEYYNPVDYRIYNAERFIKENPFNAPILNNDYFRSVYENYFCKYKSVRLMKKSGRNYDTIVLIRPDLKLKSEFNSEELIPIENTLYIPARNDCIFAKNVCDYFAISDPRIIEIYVKSFFEMQNHYIKESGGPERPLAIHLMKNNLKFKLSSLECDIERLDGSGLDVIFRHDAPGYLEALNNGSL